MESRRRSWQDRRWRQSQNLPVSPALAQWAGRFLPWCLCQKHIRRGLQHRTGRARKHSTTCSDLDKHPPVNHLVGMKVSQPLKSTVGNCSYFHLLQRLLVNCRGPSQTQRCQSCVRWWWGSTWKGKGVTVRALNLPSNKSDAEPRQYSITSCNKMKQIFVWMDCLLFLITSCGCWCAILPRQCAPSGNILCTRCCWGAVFSAGISPPWWCLATSAKKEFERFIGKQKNQHSVINAAT